MRKCLGRKVVHLIFRRYNLGVLFVCLLLLITSIGIGSITIDDTGITDSVNGKIIDFSSDYVMERMGRLRIMLVSLVVYWIQLILTHGMLVVPRRRRLRIRSVGWSPIPPPFQNRACAFPCTRLLDNLSFVIRTWLNQSLWLSCCGDNVDVTAANYIAHHFPRFSWG